MYYYYYLLKLIAVVTCASCETECVLLDTSLESVVPGQVESKYVSIQKVLRHHVIHDWSLSSSGQRWVGQPKDAVKLGDHKVLTWLVCAQTNLLVCDHDATNLGAQNQPITTIYLYAFNLQLCEHRYDCGQRHL